jgi:hypothetical protein
VRRFISLVNEREHAQALACCHPEVEAIARVPSRQVVRGIDELARFLREVIAERAMYEVTVASVRSLDDRRLIVESRMRWMDEDHVLRDDPVVWALELEEGLLRRSTPVRTVSEAEALLSAAGRTV